MAIPIKDNRMELYEQGLTDRQIARALGLNTATINNWRKFHKLPGNGKDSCIKSSLCWSCTRARAKPDPIGCAFHRRGHERIFDEAETYTRSGQGNGYTMEVVIVTKCRFYDLSLRDLQDRQRGGGDEE